MLDDRGRFDAVHPGHLHVHEDERELAVQKLTKRVFAGDDADHLLTQRREDRLEREQVGLMVVDHQDPRARLRRRPLLPGEQGSGPEDRHAGT